MKDFFARMMNSKDPTVSSGVFLSVITVLTILYTWLVVSFTAAKFRIFLLVYMLSPDW